MTATGWVYKRRKPRRRHRVLGAVVGFVLAASLSASAVWLMNGQTDNAPGRGDIGTATMVNPTVSAGTVAPNTQLLPGQTAEGTFTITNSNSFAVTLTAVAAATTRLGGTNPAGANTSATCAGWVYENAQTGLSINVPTGTSQVRVPNAFWAHGGIPSACQGLTITQNVKLSFSGSIGS